MPDLAHNESWNIEQRKREISRLESILRNPKATHEDKHVAGLQLHYWKNPEKSLNNA